MLMEDFAMSDAGFVGDDEEMVDNDYDWDAPVMMQEDVMPSNEVQEYDMIEEEVLPQPVENPGEMAVEHFEPLNLEAPPTEATLAIDPIIPVVQPIKIPDSSINITVVDVPAPSHISPIITAPPQEVPLRPESPPRHSPITAFTQSIAPSVNIPAVIDHQPTQTPTQEVPPSSSSPRAEPVEQVTIDTAIVQEAPPSQETEVVQEAFPPNPADVIEGTEGSPHADLSAAANSQETVPIPISHHIVLYYGEEVFSLFSSESSDTVVLLQEQPQLYAAPLSQLLHVLKNQESERLQGVEGCVLGLEYQPLDLCIDENSKYADVYTLQDFCTAMESCNHTSIELTLYQVADFQFTLMERLKGILPQAVAADNSYEGQVQEQPAEVQDVIQERPAESAEVQAREEVVIEEVLHTAEAGEEEAQVDTEELREVIAQETSQDVQTDAPNNDSEESEYAEAEEGETETLALAENTEKEIDAGDATKVVDPTETNLEDTSTAPDTDANNAAEYGDEPVDQAEVTNVNDQNGDEQAPEEVESQGTLESSEHAESALPAGDDEDNWDEEDADGEVINELEQYDGTNDYTDAASTSEAFPETIQELQVDHQNSSSQDDISNATDGGVSVPTHTTDLPEDDFPDNEGAADLEQVDALLDNAPPLPDEDDFDELAEYDYDENETTYGGDDSATLGQQEADNTPVASLNIPTVDEQLDSKLDRPIRRNSSGKRSYAESEGGYEELVNLDPELYNDSKRPRVE